ncbi:MAG: sugar phosphate isomerase/epimerase [Clostridia bacterium]|nr:sugar phosphate isomerase/epimerase [Clostridia bacterium]
MKIGAMLDSFRLGFREGVEKAASLGVEGLQIYATGGEICPETMTDAKVREALDIIHSHGMVVSALCADFGLGFADPEKNPELIEKSKRILDLSNKMECGIATTHIGHVPDEECETKEIMRKACRELALYADSVGAAFAVETGPEIGRVLGEFLDSLGAGGVRVNFDPANLVMCVDERPQEALKYLGKYVVHTHAKDGIMLKNHVGVKKDGNLIVSEEAKHHEALMKMGHTYLEVPLGQGDVDFDTYLPALAATGYNGFLTIEREVGDNPAADIELAVNFLKEKIKKYGLDK